MFDFNRNTVDHMAGPAMEMFETWISFFPTAPLFGVQWRFAPHAEWPMKGFMPFAPAAWKDTPKSSSPKRTAAKPKPARKKPDAPTFEQAAKENAELLEGAGSVASPAAELAAAPTALPTDSVASIRGIGPALAKQLSALGIETLEQMAALTEKELSEIDAALTSFKGRCFRDDWIGQAKSLIGK